MSEIAEFVNEGYRLLNDSKYTGSMYDWIQGARRRLTLQQQTIERLQKENKELKDADRDHLSARKGLEQRYYWFWAEEEKKLKAKNKKLRAKIKELNHRLNVIWQGKG